jgi:hypothetical protein
MTSTILPVGQQAKLIQDISLAYAQVMAADPINGLDLSPLYNSFLIFRLALPDIAASADGFYDDDFANEVDMRELYPDGFQLVSLFVMLDVLGLEKANSLSSVISSLDALGEDLSDLYSYAATYNGDNGQFDLVV